MVAPFLRDDELAAPIDPHGQQFSGAPGSPLAR
jgi:hypothetical protein